MKKIYDVFWRGQKTSFIVSNPHDLVEACFVKGHFFSIEELDDLLHYIKPNAVILDIGANIGNHTIFFAKHMQAKSVVPFEVNPSAVELLRMNVELNHLVNVDLSRIGVGVGAQPGNIYIKKLIKNNLSATSFSTSPSSNLETTVFPVDTLDNLLSFENPIDFVKIDVEGMEFEALEGGVKLIQKHRPIVFLECWAWVSSLKLLCWLVANHYRIEKKYGPSYLIVPLTSKEFYSENYVKELDWMSIQPIVKSGEAFVTKSMLALQQQFKISAHVSYAFAEVFLKLNEIEAACKAMQDVEDASAYEVVAWYQTKAELSERCGDVSSKLEALRKAARLSQDDIQIIEQLSNAYLTSGNEEGARSLITGFLERNPESARGHYIQSMLVERQGQGDQALMHAGLAAKLDSPDKPSFLVRFAELTSTVGKSPVAALGIINEAIRLGQTSDWALHVKSRILESLDKSFNTAMLLALHKTRAFVWKTLRKLKHKFSSWHK